MNFSQIVDELGTLKAEIAALTKREEALKTSLIAANLSEIDGVLYRATVSHGERSTLDMDAVRGKLSPQFIAAHTRTTTTTSVRVVACVRAKAAAA